jgi:hypothetical protein
LDDQSEKEGLTFLIFWVDFREPRPIMGAVSSESCVTVGAPVVCL